MTYSLSKRNENFCSLENQYSSVYSGFIPISKNWRQCKYPSTVKWIDKVRNIYTVTYYSKIIQNGIRTHATTWVDFTLTVPKAISKGCIFCDLIWGKSRAIGMQKKKEKKMELAGARSGGGLDHKEAQSSLLWWQNCLYIDFDDVFRNMHCQIEMRCKKVNFKLCKLYH